MAKITKQIPNIPITWKELNKSQEKWSNRCLCLSLTSSRIDEQTDTSSPLRQEKTTVSTEDGEWIAKREKGWLI